MKKLISFRKLKELCKYEDLYWCEYPDIMRDTAFKCNGKDCPIWERLESKSGGN